MATQKQSKYKNKGVYFEGDFFHSKGELNRFLQLRLLQDKGEIEGLHRQEKIAIRINGTLFRTYIADFSYYLKGELLPTYEDFKGFDTPVSKMKRDLIKLLYNIDILITK